MPLSARGGAAAVRVERRPAKPGIADSRFGPLRALARGGYLSEVLSVYRYPRDVKCA